MIELQIHPQLLQDCHRLGEMNSGTLLLNRNGALPWFILVPATELEDLLDLGEAARNAVMADCALISEFVKSDLGYSKLNFAGLGNVVPQMHLHIIGRADGDDCWPQPVWGNLSPGKEYSAAQVDDWRQRLVKQCGLIATRA
jgi:diadenosine tetraphosphate (Ap4A) HIT family hydrolase